MIDVNGNGYVSLAEFDKAVLSVLNFPKLFQTKSVLIRAFSAAKGRGNSKSRYGEDYIEKGEYRHLLKYIRQYYEYYVAFERVDTDGDKRISKEEFEKAAPYLERWGIDMKNPQS